MSPSQNIDQASAEAPEAAGATPGAPAGAAAPESAPNAATAAEAATNATAAATPTDSAAPGELEALRAEVHSLKDRLLRCQAELDNTRKRFFRDLEETQRYGILPLARDLLPVWDNLRRAIEAADKASGTAGLLEGVQMVSQQFRQVFQKFNCQEVPALGLRFDPQLHEVLLSQPSDEHPPGTILSVVRDGFQMHDRVLRPAQVIVAAAPAATTEQAASQVS